MEYKDIIELVKSTKKIVFDQRLKREINKKGNSDFVTAVDLEISKYLKKELFLIDPTIGFMSEEEKNGEIKAKRWILDPIDGTTNLIYDYNMSSISLALLDNDKIVFGVVYNPFSEETFSAELGKGATLNSKKLTRAKDRDLSESLIEFGAGSTRKVQSDIAFSIAKDVFLNCLDLRRICSSALAICYIATGRINGYFEKELKPWDYAAASLILEECGGVLTDWNGNNLPYDQPSSIICGTPVVYSELMKIIQPYK